MKECETGPATEQAAPPIQLALIGYGKMGRTIERLALEQGDTIAGIIEQDTAEEEVYSILERAEVAIEFTTPSSAVNNILCCFQAQRPVVCGTTGWYERIGELQQYALEHQNAALIYGPNFSIGVNLFFAVNDRLGRLATHYPHYQVAVSETHHVHKLDAPSGTAIRLAESYIGPESPYNTWKLVKSLPVERNTKKENKCDKNGSTLPVEAIREGEVNGKHRVILTGPYDRIALEHEAYSREGFAQGALMAAHHLATKNLTGIHTFYDSFFKNQ